MIAKPLVSIIIPTYNRSKFLKQTVSHCLNQSYTLIEVIILDDGSDDDTKESIDSIGDSRIVYINAGRTGDVGKLRNLGIRHSKGEYVAFCDDDDLWEINKLEIQLSLLNEFKFVCTNANIIDENGIEISKTFYSIKGLVIEFSLVDILKDNYILTSSVVIAKQLAQNYFLEQGSSSSAEDYELWLRLSENFKICFFNKELVSFRKHKNTTSFGTLKDQFLLKNNVLRILKQYVGNANESVRKAACTGFLKRKREIIRLLIDDKRIMLLLKEVIIFLYFRVKFSIMCQLIFQFRGR